MSIPQQMVSKVHQGSIIGPLVFSLFVTDLPNCLNAFNELMHAGYTVLYHITLPQMQTSYFKC